MRDSIVPGSSFSSRSGRLALIVTPLIAVAASCWSSGITENEAGVEEVSVNVVMRVRGNHANLGPIDAHVFVYASDFPVSRGAATVAGSQVCSFGTATSKSCSLKVPRGSVVTLLAAEGRPGIATTVHPEEPGDTTHSGQFVEFANWVNCTEEVEPGSCLLTANSDESVGAEFDVMTEIVVYQVGSARMDYLIAAPKPALRIPDEPVNALHGRGCALIQTHPFELIGCTALVRAGSTPVRRLTAHVSRGSSMAMRTLPGEATTIKEWTPVCAYHFYSNGCGIVLAVAPDSTAPVIRYTLWYDYWQCPTGPEDRDTGTGCVLVKP